MTKDWLDRFVRESNLIEGIRRDPTAEEFEATRRFLHLDVVGINDIVDFVRICAGAPLRIAPGMDVYVGDHEPPPGGPGIGYSLDNLMRRANDEADAYKIHVEYETLHPFMDGNGRSGRVLWAWMMRRLGDRLVGLGFLHAWYYQSLSRSRDNSSSQKDKP